MEIPSKSLQLALSLPNNPSVTIHAHVTFFKTNTMLFLTTAAAGNSGGLMPMGSFVYAMPNRLDPRNVLSTTLYSSDHTIDHANRMARILARRMNVPVYVGCSMMGARLTVEEEMESFTEVTKLITDHWNQHAQS